MSDDGIHVLGVRHHGPGSARSVLSVLERLDPDLVLVEGPPDAESVLGLAADEGMRPPVALLVYVKGEPRRGVFYPFAIYSPEWQAIQYALSHGIGLQFMDLPQAVQLAVEDDESAGTADAVRDDPLGALAEAAGVGDGERWWDLVVESRRTEDRDVFEAVAEVMTELRGLDEGLAPEAERRREAFMRRRIRKARKDGHERVAVVCGAWHVPALACATARGQAKADDVLLKGLRRVKTEAAWVPWTYERLWERSGYGAGVRSPAWYELLWSGGEELPLTWLTRAARLLRDEDLDASSAHVIEAARLANALAALRGRPVPGLDELEEATRTVFCSGEDTPLALVRRRLVVGVAMGAVPEGAPSTPLQQDLQRLQKRLRLPPKASQSDFDLDLRKPMALERSHLLHRLLLLDVPWGEQDSTRARSRGTFHELWHLCWEPEFAVALIDAARWGTTVAEAAAAKTAHAAAEESHLARLTGLVERALLADLPPAVASLVAAIQARTADAADVLQLMEALPALARTCRYGDVRGTDVAAIRSVLGGMLTRIAVGLPNACHALDPAAARSAADHLRAVDVALATLQADERDMRETWHEALRTLLGRRDLPGQVTGRACRLLHDAGGIEEDETARRFAFALSKAGEPAAAAAWVEGLLAGSGAMLLHDDVLWRVLDQWVVELSAAEFTATLPLIRRTFATFAPAERRQMGARAKQVGGPTATQAQDADFDEVSAGRVLKVVAQLLDLEAEA